MKRSTLDANIIMVDRLCLVTIGTQPAIRAAVLSDQLIDGQRVVHLDRLVHSPWVNRLGRWDVSGAISSILREVDDRD